MSFQPLISIVIPVYNGSNYVAEAINSALAQTYKNFEIIVVNDGSTDNGATAKIVKDYGERIRYIEKENGGVASALNRGIKEMRGEYFSWLSHDDRYLPNKLEEQVLFLERFEIFDSIIYSDYYLIDSKGERTGSVIMKDIEPSAILQHLYNDQSMHGCSMLIPKKAFFEHGFFPENLPTTQDYELWLEFAKHYNFFRQANILIEARQHEAQGSRIEPNHKAAVEDFFLRHLPTVVNHANKSNSAIGLTHQVTTIKNAFAARISQNLYGLALKTIKYGYQICTTPEAKKFLTNQLMRALPKVIALKVLRSQGRINKAKKIVNSLKVKNIGNFSRLDFQEIYDDNIWEGSESFSGAGSNHFQTRVVKAKFPEIIKMTNAKTILDAPCGDFNWMREVDLAGARYVGGDIVEKIVEKNRQNHNSTAREFIQLNIISGKIPQTDLIFCRDCLVHLPLEDALKAIENFKKSGAKWLLTTTFTDRVNNPELKDIVWRPLNLQLPPFNLPAPEMLINEKCTEGGGAFADKSLGLWKIDSIERLN